MRARLVTRGENDFYGQTDGDGFQPEPLIDLPAAVGEML
jgi:hypothetical protein